MSNEMSLRSHLSFAYEHKEWRTSTNGGLLLNWPIDSQYVCREWYI
jgi:hypothetical protein